MPGDGGDVKGCQGSVPDLLDVGPAVQQRCQQLRVVLREVHTELASSGSQLPGLQGSPAELCAPSVPSCHPLCSKQGPTVTPEHGVRGWSRGETCLGTTSLSFAI